jgi:hypothetical protein
MDVCQNRNAGDDWLKGRLAHEATHDKGWFMYLVNSRIHLNA